MKQSLRPMMARLAAVLSLLVLLGCPQPKTCVDVLHLDFDGNLVDSSISHHAVTSVGVIRYGADRFADRSRTIVLDSGAYLSVAHSPDLSFGNAASFTLTAWVRTRDTNAGIICKGPASQTPMGPALPGYQLSILGGHPHAELTAAGGTMLLKGATNVSDNFWHLLTLVVTPGNATLYMDTAVVASQAGHPRTDSLNTAPLLIGKRPTNPHTLVGMLDLIAIQPCAKTAKEVATTFGQQRSLTVINLPDFPPGIGIDTASDFALDLCWITDSIGYACGTKARIGKTTNKGASWQWSTSQLGGGKALRSISFDGSGNGLAVGSDGSVVQLTDLTPGSGALPNAHPISINSQSVSGFTGTGSALQFTSTKFIGQNTVVAVGGVGGYSGVPGFAFGSSDGGTTWTNITPTSAPPVMCAAKSVSGANGKLWVAGEGAQLWKGNATSFSPQTLSVTTIPGLPASSVIRTCDFATNTAGVLATADGWVARWNGTTTATLTQWTGKFVQKAVLTSAGCVALVNWQDPTTYEGYGAVMTEAGGSWSGPSTTTSGFIGAAKSPHFLSLLDASAPSGMNTTGVMPLTWWP